MTKGGDWHAIRQDKEIRQEEKITVLELQDIRRKVKGALAELTLALRTLDKRSVK